MLVKSLSSTVTSILRVNPSGLVMLKRERAGGREGGRECEGEGGRERV